MQGIPKRSRTDICLFLIGESSIHCEIDRRKLIFFGQLCRLTVNHFSREIFLIRLSQNLSSLSTSNSFISDIKRVLVKYNLAEAMLDFFNTGMFPSKYVWSYVVKRQMRLFFQEQWETVAHSDA